MTCLKSQEYEIKLSGQYAGKWECHILPDWLLIWEQHDDELVLIMTNTGSHNDVF